MNNELPKIDIPVDWVIGTDISPDILSLYTNFPCRLKAKIFVYCAEGEAEGSINLTRYHIKPYNIVTILPGTILQIHKVSKDLRIYVLGFSSQFMEETNGLKPISSILHLIQENPVTCISEKKAPMMENYFSLLIQLYYQYQENIGKPMISHLLSGVLLGIKALYKDNASRPKSLSKSEQIHKDFMQLVMQNYMQERNVSFYAEKLGITQAHLCTTVKQISGKTCTDIISSMVIMDAKAQLKSTDLSIHDIAYSLNFTNMSFFGKYFKRHVGMGPLEYRNS
jgi:AraC-like DNA-binding protein